MKPSLPDNILPDGKYSISQVCSMLGIHRNTLARYSRQGRINFFVRISTAKKFYLGKDIIDFFNSNF